STLYNRTEGSYTVIYGFAGTGTEFGSLEDGNYQLQFNEAAIQGGGPGGPGLAPAGDPFAVQAAQFYRYFGDSNAGRKVDDAVLAAFQSAHRSRIGQSAYRSFFDFDGNSLIDSGDYNQFLRRYHAQLNSDGTKFPGGVVPPGTVYVDDSWAG